MLELYQFEGCPHCKAVRKKLSELNLDYISRSVEPGTRKRQILVTLGEKDQVPFLVDIEKEVFMYGSEDIIAYLDKNYG